MKLKRNLSLMLVYVLLLMLLPMNFIAIQVKAENLSGGNNEWNGVKNYNLNYDAQNFYVQDVQRMDNAIVVFGDNPNYGGKELIVLNEDGTSTIVKTNMKFMQDYYLGVYNGKAYYKKIGNASELGEIYRINLNDGTEEKIYNIQKPAIPGIKDVAFGSVLLNSEGSIIINYTFSTIDNPTMKQSLLKVKDHKESNINLYDKGIQEVIGLYSDNEGNTWVATSDNTKIAKVDSNNSVTVYSVDLEGYSIISGVMHDSKGNLWAKVDKWDSATTTLFTAVAKLSISGNTFVGQLYGKNQGISDLKDITVDEEGYFWILDGTTTKKFVNNSFVDRYKFDSYDLNYFDVVDENQLVVAESMKQYAYINNKATILGVSKIVGPSTSVKDVTANGINGDNLGEVKTEKDVLPQTGSPVDMTVLFTVSMLMIAFGTTLIFRGKRKIN